MRIDQRIAWSGLTTCVPFTIFLWWRYHTVVYTAIGLLCLAAFAAYLLLPDKQLDSKTVGWRLGSASATLLLAAFVAFLVRPDAYSRPLAFFGLLALAGALLATETVLDDNIPSLLWVLLIGFLLVWTATSMFPTLVGLDPYTHRELAVKLAAGDTFPLPTMPGMVVWVAALMKAFALDYKWAAFWGVTVVQVVADATLVYAIGSTIFNNRRVGILAALLTTTAGWHIFFGLWPIPNTLAMTLLLLGLYLMLRWHQSDNDWWLLSMVPVIAAIFLTHVLVAVWLGMALSLFLLFSLGKKRLYRPVLLLVATLGAGFWSWHGIGYIGTLIIMIENKFNPSSLGFSQAPMTSPIVPTPIQVVSPPIPVPPVTGPTPAPPHILGSVDTLTAFPWESLLNSAGMLLFCALALLGSLVVLREVTTGRVKLLALFPVTLGGLLLVIGFVPMLAGLSVLEHRWWYAAEIILSIPLAQGIIAIAGSIRNRAAASLTVLGLSGVLIFLNIMGLPNNLDNRTLSPNQIVRYALTQDELDGVQLVMQKSTGPVGMDNYLTTAGYYLPEYADRMKGVTAAFAAGDLTSVGDTVIVRNELRGAVVGHGSGAIYRLLYNPVDELVETGYRVFYEDSTLTALIGPQAQLRSP